MRNALLETFILVMKHFLMMSQDFFLDDICNFLRLPRSEGVIDSLFLITYLALRIGKGEMDDNNNATYMMQRKQFYIMGNKKVVW